MRDYKSEFRFFTVPQWKEEEAYLRRRHQEGWKFVKLSGFCRYHFVACPPEDVIYQLDYNPLRLSEKLQYLQVFADCGWEYLQDYAGYSYFRKPAAAMQAGEEGIFCDDASRLEMIRRVFRGRMLPLLICFFCLILPQLALRLYVGVSNGWEAFFLWVYNGLFLTYLILFGWFGYHYRRLKDRVEK